MGFVQSILSRKVSPQEAAISSAVAMLELGGDFSDLERTIISLFRDQFAPLSKMQDDVFDQAIDRALDLLGQGQFKDLHSFVNDYLLPALSTPADRQGVYRLSYCVANSNLAVDDTERELLEEMRTAFGIDRVTAKSIESNVDSEFDTLYKAVASIALGLMVVTADGEVKDEEIEDMQTQRNAVQPLAGLDDVQFKQMYDLALSLYNRFLTDEDNRRAFLYNIITRVLNTRDLRTQAFHYGASICTSDGDVAQAEVDTLNDVLTAFEMKDADGEAIFNQYMDRVTSIDGRPIVK
ncbi:MAG TPA: TerB family tellurite resistance protein [Aggregatilineales bacterium]|nr:TerB family tellurite resistance protein [Aggregatilineales bacterium]